MRFDVTGHIGVRKANAVSDEVVLRIPVDHTERSDQGLVDGLETRLATVTQWEVIVGQPQLVPHVQDIQVVPQEFMVGNSIGARLWKLDQSR